MLNGEYANQFAVRYIINMIMVSPLLELMMFPNCILDIMSYLRKKYKEQKSGWSGNSRKHSHGKHGRGNLPDKSWMKKGGDDNFGHKSVTIEWQEWKPKGLLKVWDSNQGYNQPSSSKDAVRARGKEWESSLITNDDGIYQFKKHSVKSSKRQEPLLYNARKSRVVTKEQ